MMQKKTANVRCKIAVSFTLHDSYSPSVASFSYFVTFDVLKTPLMLRAVKREKQNDSYTLGESYIA
jgi:hypothetical protein